jgi:hypothetical protein
MKTYIIYEIKCNDANVEFNYVGHTTNFRNRKHKHKSTCNNENGAQYNLKIYTFIRENGGWENWSMSPLEEYECETPIQAKIQEQYWIDIKQSKLNSLRAYRSEAQKIEYHSNYFVAHKEHIKEQNKLKYNNNKEYYKELHKKYRQDNKELIKEAEKQKYIKNREVILERQNRVVVCECGVSITHSHKSRHKKSPKHLELMSKLNL